ncbi:hypothetical protein [Methylobacterium sp. J-067]|uniref:hypothetical protein n=1 Tax=Methylobacterium sp. J-067 TaxID=2836648 RepID=UPI001FBAFF55|nr:hypothetical protein [Methylobacterium sp. J-067]MCJ2025145.1 hypothetical protein [Methylobacterium sp. J-067]
MGATLVGARIEGVPQQFLATRPEVALGGTDRRDILCVRVLSRDGRYAAQARYRIVAATDPKAAIDYRTDYRTELSAYASSDMAVIARVGRSCESAKDLSIVPVSFGGSGGKEVVLQVSAGDARVRAQFGLNNQPLGEAVLCAPPARGPAIGFTAECRLPIPSASHDDRYQLSIGETGSGGGIAVRTYAIILPAAAKP